MTFSCVLLQYTITIDFMRTIHFQFILKQNVEQGIQHGTTLTQKNLKTKEQCDICWLLELHKTLFIQHNIIILLYHTTSSCSVTQLFLCTIYFLFFYLASLSLSFAVNVNNEVLQSHKNSVPIFHLKNVTATSFGSRVAILGYLKVCILYWLCSYEFFSS